MFKNLSFTVRHVFNLYGTRGKEFFKVSFPFAIVACIFAAFTGFVLCYIAKSVFHIEVADPSADTINLMMGNGIYKKYYAEISSGVFIISITLYSYFLYSSDGGTTQKISFNSVFESLTLRDWLNFLLITFIYCILSLLMFKRLFDEYDGKSGIFEINFLGEPHSKVMMYLWLNSMYDLLRHYISILLSFVLMIVLIHNRFSLKILRNFLVSLVVFIILQFCMESIFSSIIAFNKKYLWLLVSIPFSSSEIPTFEDYAITLIIVSVCILGYASILYYTVLFDIGDTMDEEEFAALEIGVVKPKEFSQENDGDE